MADDALNELFQLDQQSSDIDKAILETKSKSKSIGDVASDYWNSGYAVPITAYGTGTIAGAGYAKKLASIYKQEWFNATKAQLVEAKALNALKTGQPIKGSTVVQRGGVSSPELYKAGKPYYPEGASSKVSTIRATTPTRSGLTGMVEMAEKGDRLSNINRNFAGRALRYFLPEARTPDVYQDGKLVTRGTPIRIAQRQPTVSFRALDNAVIPDNGISAPRMYPPATPTATDIAPYGIGEKTGNIGLVAEDGTLLTGTTPKGKDVKLVKKGKPASPYGWQYPEPPAPSVPTTRTGVAGNVLNTGEVVAPKYVNPKIDPELWVKKTVDASKYTINKVWDGVKWVATNPTLNTVLKVVDAGVTGLNALNKYDYVSQKVGKSEGIGSAVTELSRLPLNYYTGYVPAIANMAVNAVTPNYPSIDLLNMPTFLRDQQGIMNPYGEGYTPEDALRNSQRLPFGNEDQVYMYP